METCETSASLRASALIFALLMSKILLRLATSLTVGGGLLCLKLSLGQIMPNPNICDHWSIYIFHDGIFSKQKLVPYSVADIKKPKLSKKVWFLLSDNRISRNNQNT